MSTTAEAPFRRVIYRSNANPATARGDLADILAQARVNNGLNGLSGLLWTDGSIYLQVLEGTPEAVSHMLERIERDGRHNAFDMISDTLESQRAFGGWAMASVEEDDDHVVRERVRVMLGRVPESVRRAFAGLA